MLKRKNEEEGAKTAKRVALDADALDEDSSLSTDIDTGAATREEKRVSSHRVEDPTYVHLRMLCQVKEASLVVGKGGETINRIKAASATRINVSENIRGVVERVVHVMGPAENVAKAFGLICRAVVGEDEEQPSGPESRPLVLQLLVQHQMIGYVIGKQGSRFREIEEASASKLAASPSPLPYSTDRVLSITGVADALHIAVYYVAQTVLSAKSNVTTRPIFYEPGKMPQPMMVNTMGGMPQLNMNMGMSMNNPAAMMGYGHQMPQQFMQPYNTRQPGNTTNHRFSSSSSSSSSNNNNSNMSHQNIRVPHIDQHHNQQRSFIQPTPMAIPLPSQPLTQNIYIPNEFVGNVIGKSGKNIKQLKEASGSHIIISDPTEGSTERKVTLIGTPQGNQTAIYLINNRIEINKKGNEHRAQRDMKTDAIKQEAVDTEIADI